MGPDKFFSSAAPVLRKDRTVQVFVHENICPDSCKRALSFYVLGFRATLNFRKFKVALNSLRRIFLNVAKSCILSC